MTCDRGVVWRVIASALAVWLTVVMVGCLPAVEITLFNETPEALMLFVDQREYALPVGGHATFQLFDRITVQGRTATGEYQLPDRLYIAPQEYLDIRAFKSRAMKMEIRSDRAIYVMPVAAEVPGPAPYPRQLDGFPLRPLS